MIQLLNKPGFNVWCEARDTGFAKTECFHHELSHLLFNLMGITNSSLKENKDRRRRYLINLNLRRQTVRVQDW